MADRVVDYNPASRYVLGGKSRSGKTSFGVVLASRIIPKTYKESAGWEAWWVDTKEDRRDIDRLHRWGFKDGHKNDSPRKLIRIPFEKGNPTETVNRVQEVCYKALEQHGVLLIIDEYRHCVPSTRTAGPGLLHVHQRGGGRDVGLIGMTQEPVEIPRQLFSQAQHIFLFNFTYPYDIKYAQTMFKGYVPPNMKHGHRFGFYHGWPDGDGEWRYYRDQASWGRQFEPAGMA